MGGITCAYIGSSVCQGDVQPSISSIPIDPSAPEVTPAEVGKDNKENKHGLTGSL